MPLLYDRDCGFCRFSVALVLVPTGAGGCVPSLSRATRDSNGTLPEADRLASAHVVEPDGGAALGGRGCRRRVQGAPRRMATCADGGTWLPHRRRPQGSTRPVVARACEAMGGTTTGGAQLTHQHRYLASDSPARTPNPKQLSP